MHCRSSELQWDPVLIEETLQRPKIHKRRIEKKMTNSSLSSPSAQLWKHMLPIMKENEWSRLSRWYEVLNGWTTFPEAQRTFAWDHALPLIDLLSSIEVLGSRACQLSSLLIRSEVWRSFGENRSGTDLAVGGKPDYIGAERLHLLLLRVFGMGFQGIVQPKMKTCHVKHNVPAAFYIAEFQKEQIKHH